MHITITRSFAVAALLVSSLAACSASPQGDLARAEEFRVKHDFRAAVIELKAVLQDDPENAKARWVLGQVYLDTEDGAAAEKELQRAKTLGVVDNSVVPALAQALLLQGKVDNVLALRPKDSDSPSAKAELSAAQALALASKGELDDAKARMDAAVAGAPNSAWVKLAHAGCWLGPRTSRQQNRFWMRSLLSIQKTLRPPVCGVASSKRRTTSRQPKTPTHRPSTLGRIFSQIGFAAR